jgi:hypothetical protein
MIFEQLPYFCFFSDYDSWKTNGIHPIEIIREDAGWINDE